MGKGAVLFLSMTRPRVIGGQLDLAPYLLKPAVWLPYRAATVSALTMPQALSQAKTWPEIPQKTAYQHCLYLAS